jgi:hypothetical protein
MTEIQIVCPNCNLSQLIALAPHEAQLLGPLPGGILSA